MKLVTVIYCPSCGEHWLVARITSIGNRDCDKCGKTLLVCPKPNRCQQLRNQQDLGALR